MAKPCFELRDCSTGLVKPWKLDFMNDKEGKPIDATVSHRSPPSYRSFRELDGDLHDAVPAIGDGKRFALVHHAPMPSVNGPDRQSASDVWIKGTIWRSHASGLFDVKQD